MSLFPIPAFNDNYIWVFTTPDGESVLVDPGDASPVLQAFQGKKPPVAVLITHHHADHCGGLPVLLEHWPHLQVIAPIGCVLPVAASQIVHEGETVSIAGAHFEVLMTPGHTLTHCVYVGEGCLFAGDTLFSLGCGRLFEGTAAQMRYSLDRLAQLPNETLLACAHEYTLSNAAFALAVDPHNSALISYVETVKQWRAEGKPSLPSTLAIEKECNPFLRTGSPQVKASIQQQVGRVLVDDNDAFAELRRWKDHFRS